MTGVLAGLVWTETVPGEQWSTNLIPDGEVCAPRIRRSSKNSDGSYTFFCYREGRYLDCAKSFVDAKAIVIAGIRAVDRTKSIERIKKYVDEHKGEIPPFLTLTKDERAAIRAQYPMAAPRPSALSVPRKANGGTPNAAKADLVAGGRKANGRRAAPADLPEGVLVRLKAGNPKAAGSDAHKRWELLLDMAEKGATVAAFIAAKGNATTLKNAMAKGYVEVKS